jgi:hypothetical protein
MSQDPFEHGQARETCIIGQEGFVSGQKSTTCVSYAHMDKQENVIASFRKKGRRKII